MTITTLSSREFNQHTSHVGCAEVRSASIANDALPSSAHPTDCGRPAHFLLSIDDYRKLAADQMTLIEALAQHGVPDIDFEPPYVGGLCRPARL